MKVFKQNEKIIQLYLLGDIESKLEWFKRKESI